MSNATDTTPKAKPPRERKAPRLAGEREEARPTPSPEPVSKETVAGRSSRGAVRSSIPWVLVALTTAAAVMFALLWRNVDSELSASRAIEHQRAQVVATGTDFLSALTNFSGDTIDADVQRIRGFAVGDFAQQVDQFFGVTNVAALKKGKVVSVGRVRSVFVESIDGPQATAFGVVDEAVRSAHSAPHTDTLRIDLELLDSSSGWRVSRVDILLAPGGGPLG